jgi:hypothetical protein
MQDDDLVAVGEFSNDIEAQQAINLLAENGIVAQMNDDGGAFDLGIGELPAVEVIVASSNYEKAKTLLADLEAEQGETCPAWTCQCGEEVDEGFFACWSCGAEYAA